MRETLESAALWCTPWYASEASTCACMSGASRRVERSVPGPTRRIRTRSACPPRDREESLGAGWEDEEEGKYSCGSKNDSSWLGLWSDDEGSISSGACCGREARGSWRCGCCWERERARDRTGTGAEAGNLFLARYAPWGDGQVAATASAAVVLSDAFAPSFAPSYGESWLNAEREREREQEWLRRMGMAWIVDA